MLGDFCEACRSRQKFLPLVTLSIRYCGVLNSTRVLSFQITMSSPRLPNYLRAHRKRLALSQDEVAFLLGTQSGAKVCRYERFVREPSLITAFAYEAIFQTPARELFGGLYQKIAQEVAARAKALSYRPRYRESGRHVGRKRQALLDIAGQGSKKPRTRP
jgi:transcriptional regulator with XRE-family HTH domain